MEDPVEGYDSTKTSYLYNPNTGVVTVTNVRTPETTEISVKKEWDDGNNQDGLRPASVTVTLYANGESTNKTATLNAGNNWSYTWKDLAKNSQGKAITYTVEETALDGYNLDANGDPQSVIVTANENGEAVITNKRTPDTVSVPVTKVWVDANNQDGMRPASITVTLYADDAKKETLVLSASNNWKGSFDNLPKNAGGKVIAYTVQETAYTVTVVKEDGTTSTVSKDITKDSPLPGYTANVSGTTITNTHTPETIQVVANKVWIDDNNNDGKRPTSITLHLLKNGIHSGDTKIVTPDANGSWTATWKDLPKYSGGTLISYTVTENAVDGYTTTYNHVRGDETITATITNSRENDKTSITVEKLWDDKDNQDGKRPSSITVELYANQVSTGKKLELTAANGWIGSFTGLDVNADGKPITYTVVELNPVYGENSVTYSTDTKTGNLEVTNTHTPETVEVPITKIWEDANDQDGKRPDSVTVELYADGEKTGITKEVTGSGNTWTAVFEDLPKYSNGTEVVYTVEEVDVPAGYTAVPSGTTITNKYTPEVISVPVTKVWEDNNDQDGIRPDSITVTLYANGTEKDTLELSIKNNWHGSFTNLPKYQNGSEIKYSVAEATKDVPAGYTPSVDGTKITNSHTPEELDLNVEKVWDDFGNQDGKRPYAVVITLYADAKPLQKVDENGKPMVDDDGNPIYYTLTLNAANGWKGSWDNMPKFENGEPISYTIVESGHYDTENGALVEAIPEGYTVKHSYNTRSENYNPNVEEPKAIVTNSYTPESTGLNVQKHWDDDNNRDGLQPASITVKLVRSTDKTNWEDVPGADGNPRTAVLSANEWDADFTGLPKYANGKQLHYSVREIGYTDAEGTYHEGDIPGYTATVGEVNENTGVVTITNTHEIETTSITINKVWEDNNDQDGVRPENITVTLYANGKETDNTVTLNEGNKWSHTWTGLPVNAQGEPITYTVEEVAVTGYNLDVHGAAQNMTAVAANGTATITNKRTPDTVSVPVAKVWNDNNNQDGIRPDSITVTLYADGKATDKTATLNAGNNWRGSFDNLPKNAGGEEIAYTVQETAYTTTVVHEDGTTSTVSNEITEESPLPGYTASIDGTTITNTHEVEKTTFTAVKVWDDASNQDGKRPDSITLHLLADSVHMGDDYKRVLTVTNNATDSNTWSYTWENLDKYAAGKLIRYTVYEEPVYFKTSQPDVESEDGDVPATQAVDSYTASYKRDSETQVTITNSYTPETTVITAMKVWDDGDNRDNLRPTSITVSLLADNKPTGKTVTLNEENEWVDSWTDLPKYANGVEIVYTVAEENVPTGYARSIKRESEYAPGLFIITNTHVPATTGVSVTKIWDDEDNNDGKRPDGIIVQLSADGSDISGGRIVLDESNRWSYTWVSTADMPLYVYNQGELIEYYVREIGYVIDGVEYTDLESTGYKPSYDTSNSYAISITNTRATEKLSVSVVKEWDDADDNDGIRPSSVEVTLRKNGTDVETVTLNSSNKWTKTWDNLYKYAGGVEVEYTVVETAVTGYEAAYSVSKADKQITLTVTNTHEIETKDRTIAKVWKDCDDEEGKRPGSVTAQLYKNGKAYGDPIKLTAANNWKHTAKLPVYEDGEKIDWTVKEVSIPRYYTVSYDQKTLTITNTIQSKEVPKTGDFNNLWIWILLLGGCSAGAAAVVVYDRKKKYKQ